MKSGASDPFGDEDSEERDDEDSPTASTDEHPRTTTEENDSYDGNRGERGESESGEVGRLSRDELPYVLRRERVKDERPEVHQLFVQQETHEQAVDAERELEAMLDADLSRTDAREAIYLAGMAHLDEAATILREWGYDL